MSRHPSPGPSYSHALPAQHNQQMEITSLYHSPAVLANPAFQAKMRAKNYPGGITASVEDAKYHAKYKDLKRTVKEIEAVSRASTHLSAAFISCLSRTMTGCTSNSFSRRKTYVV